MRLPLAIVAVGLALAGGCHFKSLDSYRSAATPNAPGPGKGDPYANGGIAGSNGGRKAQTSVANSTPAQAR